MAPKWLAGQADDHFLAKSHDTLLRPTPLRRSVIYTSVEAWVSSSDTSSETNCVVESRVGPALLRSVRQRAR